MATYRATLTFDEALLSDVVAMIRQGMVTGNAHPRAWELLDDLCAEMENRLFELEVNQS